MYFKTRYWTEDRSNYRAVDSFGEEVMYEEYTYEKTCSKKIVVFDDTEERQRHHALLLSVKPYAAEYRLLRTQEITDTSIQNDISGQNEYNAALEDWEQRYNNYNLWDQFWIYWHDPKPIGSKYIANWVGFSDTPQPYDHSDHAIEVACESDEMLVFLQYLETVPTDYDWFSDEVTSETYKQALQFKELLEEESQ